MATAGGGEALGLKVGKFVEGYAFDAIVVGTDVADTNLIIWEEMDTNDDILQKIIYNAERRNIRQVWGAGGTDLFPSLSGSRIFHPAGPNECVRAG